MLTRSVSDPEFRGLTAKPRSVYIAITSPPWVSTPGRKAASPDVAFAFSGQPVPGQEAER
jgi:hypothetical protein